MSRANADTIIAFLDVYKLLLFRDIALPNIINKNIKSLTCKCNLYSRYCLLYKKVISSFILNLYKLPVMRKVDISCLLKKTKLPQ